MAVNSAVEREMGLAFMLLALAAFSTKVGDMLRGEYWVRGEAGDAQLSHQAAYPSDSLVGAGGGSVSQQAGDLRRSGAGAGWRPRVGPGRGELASMT